MEFIRGSHLDGNYYRPEVFNAREDHPNAWAEEAQGTPVPDIEANRDAFDILGYDVQPGDAVIFSAWTLLGDDAVWWPHAGTDPIVSEEHVSLKPGDYPGDDTVFPVIWRQDL
jgi:hypothetical protein